MDLERSVSPTPSRDRASCAAISQDRMSGRAPRRSAAYRLFPTIDPTPPATPVALQRASLSKAAAAAASSRRRSSSTEIAARDVLSARLLHTAPPARTIRDARKASLPELRPVQAVRGGQELVDPGSLPRPLSARDRAEGHRENTDCSLGDRHAHQLSSYAKRDASYSTSTLALSPVSELHSARARTRTRPRPNLRINVNKYVEDKPPTPPPKSSPRYPGDDRYREDDALGSPNRLSGFTTPQSRPETPVQVDEQRSYTSVGADVKVVWPTAKAGRNLVDRMHPPILAPLPNERQEKPLPPISRSLADEKVHPPSRPQTSDSARVAFPVRSSSMLPADDLPMKHVKSRTTVAPNSPPRVTLRSRLLPGLRSKTRHATDDRPNTPESGQGPLEAYLGNLDEITTRFSDRAATPDSSVEQSHTSGALSIKDNVAHDITPDSSPNEGESGVPKSSSTTTPAVSEATTTDEALSRSSAAALAAARANVAALRTSGCSAGSPERVRTSSSDAGSLNRSTSDLLSRRPSSHGLSDPIEILRALSSECEQLHERYASLRAERQKVSSGIIAKLKAQQVNPDYVKTLLDDQLSLAAISSSMDICAAKLKSLDCRREDAIAVLVTSVSQPQMSPTENIAAMIASMAVSRKASLATECSRPLLTGRSTPEIGDSFGFNRTTQQSNRTLSYGSETESVEHRFPSLSRKASWGAESVYHTDCAERQAPETILEVVESPDPKRHTHEPETVGDQNEWKSSHPSPAQQTVSNTLPPVRTNASDELLGQRIRALDKNSKAAQILGLDDKTPAVMNESEIRCRDLKHKEMQLLVPNSSTSRDETGASLLTARSMTMNGPASAISDPGDLEVQLQSFPKPNRLSPLPTPNKRDTGGSTLTNGSSAESSNGEPELVPPSQRPGRDPSPRPANTVNTTAKPATRKRDPSAHTIQVYIPGDEVLDYYNRSRELPLPPLP